METIPSFIELIQRSIITHWDLDALTDYKGVTLQYHDVARKIEKLHIMFENSGVEPGDKIALWGRNSTQWAVAFLATLTYGAVAMPILHEFTNDQAHLIVNRGDAKLLFVDDVTAMKADPGQMPRLEGIIHLRDFTLMMSRSERLTYARTHLNEIFGIKYPKFFRPRHVRYHTEESPECLAIINHTSGTTGIPKGVMIPYRALWSNLDFAHQELGKQVKAGDNLIDILPMAHMFGMTFGFLFGFLAGCHVYHLVPTPSPTAIAEAFARLKPTLVIATPYVVEKTIRKKVLPKVQTNTMRLLLHTPMLGKKIKRRISLQAREAFGGHVNEMVIGGASLNHEVEKFLRDIDFPFSVAYGCTECAPIICYAKREELAPGSCGRVTAHMKVRIASPDPMSIPGEILAKGINVMLGYHKDEESTCQSLDEEGWYHTGDLATMDANGNVFFKGREKSALPGDNGLPLCPEEMEDKLNSMPLVAESLVIWENGKLAALLHPDYDEATRLGLTDNDITLVMEQNRCDFNADTPASFHLHEVKIHEEEFAKTPKGSIKRYLYQKQE